MSHLPAKRGRRGAALRRLTRPVLWVRLAALALTCLALATESAAFAQRVDAHPPARVTPARTVGAEATDGVAYAPRVRNLVRVLRRAEGWLETLDHATGGHARLPGFGGGRSLEQQLNLD